MTIFWKEAGKEKGTTIKTKKETIEFVEELKKNAEVKDIKCMMCGREIKL